MAIGPSQAKFSIPLPPWNTGMSPGQRTHFKARYVNTALRKPVACNFFWLQQNKSLFQKTFGKTSSVLTDLRYVKCSWYVAINVLLFYLGCISKVALEKNKTENKKLTLPPTVRKKILGGQNGPQTVMRARGFFLVFFPPLPFKSNDPFLNQNLKRVEILFYNPCKCTAENTTRYDFRLEVIFPKHPFDLICDLI